MSDDEILATNPRYAAGDRVRVEHWPDSDGSGASDRVEFREPNVNIIADAKHNAAEVMRLTALLAECEGALQNAYNFIDEWSEEYGHGGFKNKMKELLPTLTRLAAHRQNEGER